MEDEPDDTQSVVSSAGTGKRGKAALPVRLDLGKVCTCVFCGSPSSDPSPLGSASKEDCYGGARPWSKYKKVRAADEDTDWARTPEGRVDLICWNVLTPDSRTKPGN